MADAWDLNSLGRKPVRVQVPPPAPFFPEKQKASPGGLAFLNNRGAGEGTRTPDPIITNDVLYQLSYTGIWLCRAG